MCAAHFCSNPTRDHWTAAKRILRYLKKGGLLHTPTESVGYCDADYAGDVEDQKSMAVYLLMQGGAIITW